MRSIPILFTFDKSLVLPACVCISSLLKHADADSFYEIVILHDEHEPVDDGRLRQLTSLYPQSFSIRFIPISKEFTNAYEIRGIPATAYFRLLAAELLPEYDKILYSDVDVIFREDLSKYYETPLDDFCFGGVDTCSFLRPDDREYIRKELGLDPSNGYFYSGNLVINLKRIRQKGLVPVFRELGKRDFKFQDMDIINIACNGEFKDLGPSFCLTNYLYTLIVTHPSEMAGRYGEAALRHALQHGIVHYNGPKPWKEECINMDIWWKYYRESVYFDERFSYDFWESRQNQLERLTLLKRIKLLLRYPIDKKNVKL